MVDAKLHNILMLLSSVIIFNNRTKVNIDDFNVFQSLTKNTFTTTTYEGRQLTKEDGICPRSLYHLYRNRSLATSSDMLKYFSSYDFTYLEDAMTPGYQGKDTDLVQCSFLTTSCVSEKYIRHISEIFSTVMTNV
jgi:hypothetical protein